MNATINFRQIAIKYLANVKILTFSNQDRKFSVYKMFSYFHLTCFSFSLKVTHFTSGVQDVSGDEAKNIF